MEKLNTKLRNLNVKDSRTPGFYRKEARQILRKYNVLDPNFKYLIKELISNTRIPEKDAEEIVLKIKKSCITQDKYNIRNNNIRNNNIRNKLKISKKEFKYADVDWEIPEYEELDYE